MTHLITRPFPYVHPLARVEAVLMVSPEPPPPELVAAVSVMAEEWNLLYAIVYEAGELLEAGGKSPDLSALRQAFAPWRRWVEQAIPTGPWVVAGEGQPEPVAPSQPADVAPVQPEPGPDDADVPL